MTKKVYPAINAVMAGLAKEGITKSRRNTQGQGFNFRGIDDVLNALSGLLVEHKLLMLPRVLNRTGEVRQSSGNKPIFVAFCEVEFDLVSAEDGSAHVIRTIGEAMDMSDKASNKAMSAAYKYAAIQAFCIPTEGDNDADAHTHDVANDAPPALGEAEQKMLRQIEECDTMPLLNSWLKEHGAAAQASPNAAQIVEAWNARKAAVMAMDRSQAA